MTHHPIKRWNIRVIKEYLSFYRIHDTNTSRGIDSYSDKEILITFLKQYKPSKKKGYSKEYEELYENFYFKHYFNLSNKYKNIWYFIYNGSLWLFAELF